MKIKLLTLVACLFAFIATADAKVYYQGNLLRDIQVHTVKGFCYDVAYGVNEPAVISWRPIFAKSLVWLDKLHADPKDYHLEKIKSTESKTIRDTIDMIIQVFAGKYPNVPPDVAAHRWVTTGRRVIVEYSETVGVNPKTKKEEKHIVWKFALKPLPKAGDPHKTKKLIYRYRAKKVF